jgi:hypothetical protein
MRSKQIKRGKTYVGKNGQRRTVDHIISVGGKLCVGVFDHSKQESWSGIPLGDFAKWARKEDK